MTRRDMIKCSGLAVVGGALATAPPAPASVSRRNFLFVHGAWHAAAHWNRVVSRLVDLGHRAVAVDLPGSGLRASYPQAYLDNDFVALASEVSPIRHIRLSDYAAAVVVEVERAARYGKVTLVGHSFGGLTITLVGERVPHLVRRLVYVTAYVPVSVPNGAGLSALPEGAASISAAVLVGDPGTTGAMRINPRDSDPAYVEKGRLAFYNDLSTAQYLPFAAYLNPDLPVGVAFDDARGSARRWGRLPRTFVRCTQDRTVPLALQNRMIADADAATPRNPFRVDTLGSGHSPFASMPDDLAALLAAG
jgi:pimeloyl-ACP methyl ester carboxylesterase